MCPIVVGRMDEPVLVGSCFGVFYSVLCTLYGVKSLNKKLVGGSERRMKIYEALVHRFNTFYALLVPLQSNWPPFVVKEPIPK